MSAVSAATDPYEILQVHRNAEPEVIRAAYRALAAKWHPDRGASPERMIEINAAWRLLGNAERRAMHDAGRAVATSQATTPDRPDVGAGLPARPPRDARAGSSIVDFGRYAGLTISQLVDQDQDYAVWLARTPIGRRLAPEIDAALVRRDAQLAELVPKPPDTPPAFLRRRVVEAR